MLIASFKSKTAILIEALAGMGDTPVLDAVTTGTASGVLTTTKVWLSPLGKELMKVLPPSPDRLLSIGIVVGFDPVPSTTFRIPLISVVLPGRLSAGALGGSPRTTGKVCGVLMAFHVSLPPPATALIKVLPTRLGRLLLSDTVVGLDPVPGTTFNVPLNSVVLPGRLATSWEIGIVEAEETMTFVKPVIIVVLPESSTEGLRGIIVEIETTMSEVPERMVGWAVMGLAPMREAVADAMAAAEEETGEIVVGEFCNLSDDGWAPTAFWEFARGTLAMSLGELAEGAYGEGEDDTPSWFEGSGPEAGLSEGEFSDTVWVCSATGALGEGASWL
jgi:hypothetical protein